MTRPIALLAVMLAGCSIEAVDIAGKGCPCATDEGWVCHPAKKICVQPSSLDGFELDPACLQGQQDSLLLNYEFQDGVDPDAIESDGGSIATKARVDGNVPIVDGAAHFDGGRIISGPEPGPAGLGEEICSHLRVTRAFTVEIWATFFASTPSENVPDPRLFEIGGMTYFELQGAQLDARVRHKVAMSNEPKDLIVAAFDDDEGRPLHMALSYESEQGVAELWLRGESVRREVYGEMLHVEPPPPESTIGCRFSLGGLGGDTTDGRWIGSMHRFAIYDAKVDDIPCLARAQAR